MTQDQSEYITETEEAMQMLGKGYNSDPIPPNEFVATVSGFTLAPDAIINEYGYVTALVWGVTWRFCQMSDGVCRAGLEKIAKRLGMSERTIIRHLDILCDGGFLFDTTPALKNKPHIYADTGKIKVRMNIDAGVTKSQRAMTESQRQGDRESVEESNKKDNKKQSVFLSEKELQQVNAKVDAIISNSGKADWQGREIFRPDHYPLVDWYHNATGQECPKSKQKDWHKAVQMWAANNLTPADLQAAYSMDVVWRGVFTSPNQLTDKAIALRAQKQAQANNTPKQEEGKSSGYYA